MADQVQQIQHSTIRVAVTNEEKNDWSLISKIMVENQISFLPS
jgi:hypothetical protein